jgi:hypothetical protein
VGKKNTVFGLVTWCAKTRVFDTWKWRRQPSNSQSETRTSSVRVVGVHSHEDTKTKGDINRIKKYAKNHLRKEVKAKEMKSSANRR